MCRKAFHIILILILSPILTLGQISVTATLDSSRVLIGDQVVLHFVASHAPGIQVRFPNLSDVDLGGLEVINSGTVDTIKSSPEIIAQQDITLAAFDSGYYAIPGLPFSYSNNGNNWQAILSNPLALEVSTIEVDTTKIAPLKPIMKEPLKFVDILPYIYGVGGLLVAAFIGLILYRKLIIKPPEIIEEEAPIPAHVTAFEKLDELKHAKLWQQGKIKEYQSELSRIVREYIENRFNKPALESTTDEILYSLRDENFSGDLKSKLRESLTLADLVKFAKAKPPADINQEVMEKAYEFVDETKQKIQLFENETMDEEE